jgi:hypothetical protein
MGEGMCIWYHCSKDDTDCKCDPPATVCETSLIIDTSLVMVDIAAKAMVFPKQNQLFKFEARNSHINPDSEAGGLIPGRYGKFHVIIYLSHILH